MLSLFCLLNVCKTSTTVTQTAETRGSSAEGGEKRKEIKNKLRNSPRLCLLALDSLRASLWPMELRKTIVSATSPSCIVPVAFPATQGPPLRPDGSGWGGPSSVGQVNPSAAGTDDPSSLLWHCSLSLSVSPFPPLCLAVSFTLVAAASASLWSGGWCCGRESKQARGTTSHHAGGSTGKGSRQSGLVGWRGAEGPCGGWRGGENGEEIAELLVVQPMKLGVGWQGSREPAVWGGFAVSECLRSQACVSLKVLCGGTKIRVCWLKQGGCRFLTTCGNTAT